MLVQNYLKLFAWSLQRKALQPLFSSSALPTSQGQNTKRNSSIARSGDDRPSFPKQLPISRGGSESMVTNG